MKTLRHHPRQETFACSAGARWLPRALAASVLVAALLAAYRLDRHPMPDYAAPLRYGAVLVGALLALVVVRGGDEVRRTVALAEDRVLFTHGSRAAGLPYGEISRLAFAPPLQGTTRWLPALVVVDREGSPWRVPALLTDGERFVEALLERAAREDLRAWATELRLARRMGRHGRRVAAGYALAALLLLAGLAFYLR